MLTRSIGYASQRDTSQEQQACSYRQARMVGLQSVQQILLQRAHGNAGVHVAAGPHVSSGHRGRHVAGEVDRHVRRRAAGLQHRGEAGHGLEAALGEGSQRRRRGQLLSLDCQLGLVQGAGHAGWHVQRAWLGHPGGGGGGWRHAGQLQGEVHACCMPGAGGVRACMLTGGGLHAHR